MRGLIYAVVASALLTLAACGDAETTSAPATGEPGSEAQLVDSQAIFPAGL